MSISYIANFDTHQIFSLHIISNISHLEEIELLQLLPLFLPKYPVSSLKRIFVVLRPQPLKSYRPWL